ncbi:zinc ribbon domain-containing protein [Aeribacillus sp. FSL K6-8210]|uniref:zinc ribbon domain-containing protein n=1 Tax=Aeribacillus sp. FSL K6-8210 TaxID=2954683 RepID=UPI0030CCAA9D
MICHQCGNEQEKGNFCGKCGAKLNNDPNLQETAGGGGDQVSINRNPQPSYGQAASTQMNEHVEKVKKQSKVYGSYFVHFLKHPSSIFGKEKNEWVNGFISIILFVFIVTLTVSVFVRNLFKSAIHGTQGLINEFYDGPSYVSVFFNVFIFVFLIVALVLLCMFIVNKLFGSSASFKEVTAIYGAHLTTAIIVSLIALLLVLLKSHVYGNIVLIISLLLAIVLIPYYLISVLLTKYSKGIDPLYSFIIYVAIFSIVFAIFIGILADSAMGRIVDQWRYFW